MLLEEKRVMPINNMQMLTSIVPFIAMVLIMYFMIYRPQKKEQQKRMELLNSLKKGDKVITISGIYGVITAIDDTKVTLKLAENVSVEFVKSAVGQVVTK